ncbi:hypothetical protein IAU59_004924 [Kwoniella sp. CBS 9459]
MSRDPYLDVKREVESTLSTLPALLQTHANTSPTSISYDRVQNDLRGTLTLLEGDLEDLEGSVEVVENMGDKWGISPSEVKRRRQFVERVKHEIENLRSKISGSSNKQTKGKGKATSNGGRYRDEPDYDRDLEQGRSSVRRDNAGHYGDNGDDGDEEDLEEAKRWEAEQQQLFVQRQDDTLGVISGTLHNLASQAGLIGHEVHEQSEMLDDLGNRVDHTDSKLRKVSRTMQDFIRRNEETKSGWCIGILIVILIILLMLVIIT